MKLNGDRMKNIMTSLLGVENYKNQFAQQNLALVLEGTQDHGGKKEAWG